MRILIAPDKFKGSLSAGDVAESIASGLRDVLPNAILDLVPIADGGEGTADVICRARNGEWVTCVAHDALGRTITCRYVWLRDQDMVVMEMSETAGGWRIPSQERNPVSANTYGVGEMLLAVDSHKLKEIIVGLGGSITNDGGFGMARALGYRFWDNNGAALGSQVSDLLKLERLESPPNLVLPNITAASDVKNPLLGARGATRTFGPQKGVKPDQLKMFEEALTRLADVATRDLGRDFREMPGAGAAGGLGFGLLSFCNGSIKRGFDIVAEMLDLEAAIARADFVVTGEGSLDGQTMEGKAPAGVAQLARKLGKQVFAIAGCASNEATVRAMYDVILELARPPITHEDSMRDAGKLLRERARELGTTLTTTNPQD